MFKLYWILTVFLPIYLVIGAVHAYLLFRPALAKGATISPGLWFNHILGWPLYVLR